jgi:hypothetical protein
MLTVALIVLSMVSTPENVGLGSAAADGLRPVLSSLGVGARINYAGICP